jgi:N-methylhydantoinase B
LENDNGDSVRLSNKPPDMSLNPNQALVVNTPGAGGYGDPKERAAESIKADELSQKFSAKYLEEFYGVQPKIR